MASYLLIWNPKNDPWNKPEHNLDDEIKKIEREGSTTLIWSSGQNKKIKDGDIVYLMRLGVNPKGIIASGEVIRPEEYVEYYINAESAVFYGEHWNDVEKDAQYVEFVTIDLIEPQDERLLGIEELKEKFPEQKWDPQGGGIRIREEYAEELDELWLSRFEDDDLIDKSEYDAELEKDVEESSGLSSEERQKRIKEQSPIPEQRICAHTVFLRDPNVIAETLFQANGKCQRCGKDAPFKKDKDDTPYLEVHHRIPLSEGGHDTLENAIALCPNCHRHAHHGKKSY